MYLILEIQKTGEQVAHLVYTASTKDEAESKYHQVLAVAAISQVPVHSAIILTDACIPVIYQSYVHTQEVDNGTTES